MSHPVGVAVELSLFNGTYTLNPSSISIPQYETLTVSINNHENYTVFVDTFFVNISASSDWHHLVLPNCTHGESHTNFTVQGQGMYFFNISANIYGTVIDYVLPAITVNVTAPIASPASTDYQIIIMDVHECRNFTEAYWNSTLNVMTYKNISLCADSRTCVYDDISDVLKDEKMNELSDTIKEYTDYLKLRDAENQSVPIENTKYFWEVAPEAQSLLLQLREMKDCTSQCETARNDALKEYSLELDKTTTELAQVQGMYDTCSADKDKVLSSMVSERKDSASRIMSLTVEVAECVENTSYIEDTVSEDIRSSEVQPLIYYSVACTLFLLIVSMLAHQKRKKPSVNHPLMN